ARQAARRGEEELRGRLGAQDPPLQHVLLAERHARPEEGLLFERSLGGARLQRVGHDAVSLDERPQHAMGAERAEATEERVDRPRPLREPALPLGVMQPHLLAELLAEGVLLGEEELELEEVAEAYRLVPKLGSR